MSEGLYQDYSTFAVGDSTWRMPKLPVADALASAASTLQPIAEASATILEVTDSALGIAKAAVVASVDTYKAVADQAIDTAQNALSDIENMGVYALLDYPITLFPPEPGDVPEAWDKVFNPTHPVNLAGTLLDPNATEAILDRKSNPSPLANLAARRKVWNPPTGMVSYDEQMGRLAQALYDPHDPLRPILSPDADCYAVVFLGHSTELARLASLVRALTNLVAVDGLDTLLPAIDGVDTKIMRKYGEEWVAKWHALTARERTFVPVSLRGGGEHPNFVLATPLGQMVPVVGDAIGLLKEGLEMLRPNGALTDAIDALVAFIRAKITRLQEILRLIDSLIQLIAGLFSGSDIGMLPVRSVTGAQGLAAALRDAHGYPRFDRAYACAVMLVLTGPSAAGFYRLLETGDPYNTSAVDAVTDILPNRIVSDRCLDPNLRQ